MRTFATPAASSFVDDFSSGVLSDRWQPVAPCIDQTGGELVATPSATAYCHAWTQGRYHLTCDAVMFRVAEVTIPVLGVQTFAYVSTPTDTSDDIALLLLLEAGTFHLSTRGTSVPFVDNTYDSVRDQWWRIRETEGELFFETSQDAASWLIRGSTPTPEPLDDVEIALGAGIYQTMPAPGRARFHCYNVPPPCN